MEDRKLHCFNSFLCATPRDFNDPFLHGFVLNYAMACMHTMLEILPWKKGERKPLFQSFYGISGIFS